MVANTLEQYFQVVHLQFHKKYLRNIKKLFVICAIWFIGVSYNFFYAIPSSAIVEGSCLAYGVFSSITLAGITGVSMVSYFFIIPASIMIVCLSHLAYVLHKRIRQTASIGIVSTFNLAKVNIIKTLFLFLATIICCWSYSIWAFFLSFFNVIDPLFYTTWPYHMSVLLIMSSCSVNPFIYAIHYKKFKQGLSKYLSLCSLNKFCFVKKNSINITNDQCITTVA